MVPTVCFETFPYSRGQFRGVFGDERQDRPQILHVQQQQSLLVRHLERNIQHAFLNVVEIHHAGEQQRPHFRDRRTHRMTLLAEHVPKHCRKPVGLEGKTHIAGPLDDKILGLADFGDPRQISLDIGGEYGNACARKSLRHHLQRNGFSGSGRPGDEAMAISKRKGQPRRLFTLSHENFLVGVGHLVIGHSHGIASSHTSGVQSPSADDHTASCKPIETGQSRYGAGGDRAMRSACSRERSERMACRDNLRRNLVAPTLALLQHLPRDRTLNRPLQGGHRL